MAGNALCGVANYVRVIRMLINARSVYTEVDGGDGRKRVILIFSLLLAVRGEIEIHKNDANANWLRMYSSNLLFFRDR